MAEELHPCQKCGACCTVYKVSFSHLEIQNSEFLVPEELTRPTDPNVRAMKTVSFKSKRCQALSGHIGVDVGCSIYENRPSPCRKFVPSLENGERNIRCDEARLAVGLQPLTRDDWETPCLTRTVRN